MRSYRISVNGLRTINLVTPVWIRPWVALAAEALVVFKTWAIFLATSSVIFFGGGQGGGRRQQSRGADLMYEMALTLEQAVHGITKEIKIPTLVNCSTCSGTGARKGSTPVDCGQCRGSGHVQIQHGFIAVQQTCPQCHGQGKVIKDPCGSCHGQGRTQERKTLSVKIPAGVDTGDRIRLTGEGEAGVHGSSAGDLYVQVNVREHDIFQREGSDLYTEVPVAFAIAALGGDITVPTLSGAVKLKIPEETQSGKLFRLRGKGVKALRSGVTGDLLCRIIIETPIKLTAEQKDMLKKFDSSIQEAGKKHSPKSKNWLDSMKDFFKN